MERSEGDSQHASFGFRSGAKAHKVKCRDFKPLGLGGMRSWTNFITSSEIFVCYLNLNLVAFQAFEKYACTTSILGGGVSTMVEVCCCL